MTRPVSCDIAVVGAGPAGSMAAAAAAGGGRSVCLIERKEMPGVPVRCGEGIGIRGLTRSLALDERWIKHRIRSVRLVSPAGIIVDLREFDEGLILDRSVMEADLVTRARASGAAYHNQCTVIDVAAENNRYRLTCADDRTFDAGVVILAEGVESRLGRRHGWQKSVTLDDIETCAFAHVTHPAIEQDLCGFYLGTAIAPGGYAWVFPRGDGSANVGLGVLGSRHAAGAARRLLDAFIDSRFPGATIADRHCGGVPVGKWQQPLVHGGIMFAGDAGRQVNCLHGGGIAYSLYAGKTAGTVAAEAFRGGTLDLGHLRTYEKAWATLFGPQQRYSFSLKTLVVNFSDADLDRIARDLSRKRSRMTYMKVLMRAFAGHPILMVKAFLMASG